MEIINFPLSLQILIPFENHISIRLMFNSAEIIKGSITEKPVHTLEIDGVRLSIIRVNEKPGNWERFNIKVEVKKGVKVAFDLSFMGNKFNVDAENIHAIQADEICIDLSGPVEKTISVWIEPSFIN
ncbi:MULTISPECIES: hypothetical protein [unclassified Pseudoalteromonas]|uniref:hypothetical protein n=1 Tax=unclassified Pseudoalteromonas TaxID=194690 RepID=UPI0004673397|nr:MULTISPECIES: hypothetical protein [unclassified Pseudoalteromonas]